MLERKLDMTEPKNDQEVADRICREFEFDGRQFTVGVCVALLNGRIVAVTENLDDALTELRSVDPDPEKGMIFEVKRPTVEVIR